MSLGTRRAKSAGNCCRVGQIIMLLVVPFLNHVSLFAAPQLRPDPNPDPRIEALIKKYAEERRPPDVDSDEVRRAYIRRMQELAVEVDRVQRAIAQLDNWKRQPPSPQRTAKENELRGMIKSSPRHQELYDIEMYNRERAALKSKR
jgi:hypothetical protein